MNGTKLVFWNPGELDLRLLSTFGASAKTTDSPIGRFGTGLKFALAAIARFGGRVTIFVGQTEYEVRARDETIRGKTFQKLRLEEQQPHGSAIDLPFTTDLGSHWQPWMAFRELWSNARDEGGGIEDYDSDISIPPTPGMTKIVVECGEITQCWDEIQNYLVQPGDEILWANDEVEILDRRPTAAVFFRGILVAQDLGHPHAFSYNILCDIPLTEDRTLANPYGLREILAKAWLTVDSEDTITRHVGIEETSYEFDLPYEQAGVGMSEQFYLAWLHQLAGRKRIPAKIRTALKNFRPEEYDRAQLRLIDLTADGLSEAEPKRRDGEEAPSRYAASSAIYDLLQEMDYQKSRADFWHRAAMALLAQRSDMPEAAGETEPEAAVPF